MSKRGQNEGSIYQMKDGRWRAAISLGWKTNTEGKPVPHRKTYTGKTRGDVQKQLTRALRDRDRGLPIVGERQTVGQFLTVWLEQVAKPNVRPSTYESYSWIVEKHLVPGLGKLSLAKLTAQQIQAFLNERLQSGRIPRPKKTKQQKTGGNATAETAPAPEQPKTLASRTVQHIHATLRAALGQALRWNLVAQNAAMLVDAPRVRRPEVVPYTPEEAKKLLDAIKGDRMEALYSAAMALGMRQGEALGLRWPDIDFEAGALSIRNSLQRVETKLRLVEVKTTRSRRTITLPQVTVDALLKHRAGQEQERQFAGDRWQQTGFVFTTSIGTPMDGSTVTHRFQKALSDAGLRRIRFHDLRHTCATLLVAQGVHPRIVMEILGHSQIGITMNLYAHVIPVMGKEVANRIDGILAPQPQEPQPGRVATRVATKPAPEVVQ